MAVNHPGDRVFAFTWLTYAPLSDPEARLVRRRDIRVTNPSQKYFMYRDKCV